MDKKWFNCIMDLFEWLLVIAVISFVVFMLASCKSIQYVPVPEYHHDSIYFTKVQFDSVYVKDSTSEKEYRKGDTVYFEKTRWHTKYKEKAVHDTSYVEKVDSVPVPYPVEKKLSKAAQFKVDYGGYALIFAFLTIIYFVIRFVKRFMP